MNCLNGPPTFDETGSEIIEQFGIRRLLTAQAKVVWRRDEALSEMMLPNAIDHDTRGKRVLGLCQPVGELSSAACPLGNLQSFVASEKFGCPP